MGQVCPQVVGTEQVMPLVSANRGDRIHKSAPRGRGRTDRIFEKKSWPWRASNPWIGEATESKELLSAPNVRRFAFQRRALPDSICPDNSANAGAKLAFIGLHKSFLWLIWLTHKVSKVQVFKPRPCSQIRDSYVADPCLNSGVKERRCLFI